MLVAWSAAPALHYNRTRRLGRTRDWLLRPLSGEWEANRIDLPLTVDGLEALFAQSSSPVPRELRHEAAVVLAEYFEAAFLYSRSVNDLVPLVRDWRTVAVELADRCRAVNAPDAALDLTQQLIGWNAVHDREAVEPLLVRLRRAKHDRSLSPASRATASIQLVTLMEAGPAKAAAASQALREHAGVLQGHQRLQLTVRACPTAAEALRRADDLLAAIDEHNATLHAATRFADEGRRKLHLAEARGRMYPLLAPAVDVLLRGGRADVGTRLLAAWQAPGHAAPAPPLFLLHSEDGAWWSTPGTVHGPGTDSAAAFLDAVPRLNRFLNLMITVRDDPGFVAENPEGELGQPNEAAADEMADTVRSLLALELLACGPLAQPEQPMCVVPGTPLPWQGVMARHSAAARPIMVSWRRPERDRPVRRVCLWDAGDVWSASMEVAGVTAALVHRNIAVDHVHDEGCTKDAFLAAYANPDYDVFWLTSHGDYKVYSPDTSTVAISPDEHLPLEDLVAAAPVGTGRRMLVLNSCDGAATGTYGGLPQLGVAALLSGASQSVVSHLWPTHSFAAAPQFGLLLANALAEGHSHAAAFRQATAGLAAGRTQLVRALRQVKGGDEIADRAQATSVAYENLAHYGSPAMYV